MHQHIILKTQMKTNIISQKKFTRILPMLNSFIYFEILFERLTSTYYHLKRNGTPITMDGMLNDWIINTTLYYDRIEPFIKKFGRKNVYILQMEDLTKSPQEMLNKTFFFLNLDSISIPDFKIHNKTSPIIKEKFSQESFLKLKPLFEEQKILLEENLGLQVNWNLEYDRWVN